MATLNWGIIGAGNIAKAFARGLAGSKTGTLLAIGSRSQEKADKWGEEFNVPRRYGSYETLLADKDIQAVYIATPHPQHAEWAIRAAEAKKHLLVEKPIGINHAEAMAIVEAAIANDVFLMEAFMYRCHPQTQRLVQLLKEKVIGEVRVIHATFSFHSTASPEGRLFKNALAGGGILDVGCYTTSMARLIAGVAMGKDFAEPLEVKAAGHLGATGVDEWAAATLRFPGDIIAQIATGISVMQDNMVRIFGTDGSITIPSPWIPAREGGQTKIIVQRKAEAAAREVIIDSSQWLYTIEADTVAANLDKRQAPSPAMSWADTLGNMRVLDEWRQGIGLQYESERPENVQPVGRRALKANRAGKMRYARVDGVAKPISRLVMGVDNFITAPHIAVMFDDFYERGGNTFDTANSYKAGKAEPALGDWIKSRGLRDQIVILDKGAHTPFCTPLDLRRQFKESLQRLQTDYVDIYMMHRDNLEIPVGEFIDAMNEFAAKGQMKIFGVSNWSLARIEEANAWAKQNGKRTISAVSNNFSLARMVNPVWRGCIASSEPEFRGWHAKTQTPLFPWSSQARGFFVDGVASPEKRTDPELYNAWYSDDNFQRQARARELAKKYGVLPVNIALAYVLRQPFPTFPLIGPRQLSETRSSLPGLDIELTPDEVQWLNLEA